MKKWLSLLVALSVVSVFAQAWFIENVDTLGDVGMFSSLAIDENNSPHIAYFYADSAFLKYATWNGASWDVEVVDNNSNLGGVGMYASLALGPTTGRPQIAYYDMNNTQLKWANLNAAGDWIIGIPDPSTTNDVGQCCDLVISEQSSQEIPNFSYYDATAGYLMYARPLGSVWSRDTVDSVGPLPIFGGSIPSTSITLDPSSNPHIAYYAYDVDSSAGFLKYAHLVSGNWVIDTVERIASTDLGLCPTIAIRVEGSSIYPYISYFDQTHGYFKYARWTGSNWAVDIIDNTPGVGMYGSQVLGSTYASYYDAPNGNLKYAYSDNYLGWHTETVDTTGDAGQYTSISLSRKGEVNFPHISYYDFTNGNLKYATKIIKDVLPTVFWLTPDQPQIRPDQAYTPMATVLNQGNTMATFDVECKVFFSGLEDYSSIKTIGPLAPDEEGEVTFDQWPAPHYDGGWYYMKVYTKLADDSVRLNDTIYDSVYCTSVVAIKEELLPNKLELSVIAGKVKLALPFSTTGELYVLDVTGSRRLTVQEGTFESGVHSFDISKEDLPSGVYFVRFHSPGISLIRKTTLIK